jgi:hypothetical protein
VCRWFFFLKSNICLWIFFLKIKCCPQFFFPWVRHWVFPHPENVGIWCSPNTLKSSQILFLKNTLPWWKVFNLAKNTLEWRGFVEISRDHPLKTRTSKQPIRKILGYEIIPSQPLKYPRSKEGLIVLVSHPVYQ